MYVGRHQAVKAAPARTAGKKTGSRRFNKKALLLVVSVVMILALAVGGTMAYLNISSKPVSNSFSAANGPKLKVIEEFSNGDTVKKNVTVKNTGDAVAYVRCVVTYTLLDKHGDISAQIPVSGTDYTVSYGADWTQGKDGFWYYTKPVSTDASTTALITTCETLNTTAQLVVDISAQAVQAAPASAVNDAWPDNPLGLS